MPKGRVEAFTDGVFAIIITIMVLEMHAPHVLTGEPTPDSLKPVLPVFLSYILSFIYIGIYWSNHHHLYHAVQRVSGMTLWANLHMLFWISLIPFVTSWMGENHFSSWPVVLYGVVLLMAAIAWEINRRILMLHHDDDSPLVRALGGRNQRKEWLSLALYASAIAIAFFNPWIACCIYALVSAIWLIPDRRIERVLGQRGSESPRLPT